MFLYEIRLDPDPAEFPLGSAALETHQGEAWHVDIPSAVLEAHAAEARLGCHVIVVAREIDGIPRPLNDEEHAAWRRAARRAGLLGDPLPQAQHLA